MLVFLWGNPVSAGTRFTIGITRIGELRDDWVFGTSIVVDEQNRAKCEPELGSGIYRVTQFEIEVPGQPMLLGATTGKETNIYFVVADDPTSVAARPSQLAHEILSKRADRLNAPLITPAAKAAASSANRYRVIVFLTGLSINPPQLMRGCWIVPLQLGVGASALDEVISAHLQQTLSLSVRFLPEADADMRTHSRTFAIHMDNVWGASFEDAHQFARQHAAYVATFLAIERGAKPQVVAVFISGEGRLALIPIQEPYRGNLAGPMFANDQAELIERYLPAVEASPRARLDLHLYHEAMAEPDPAIQYFRHWSILEMVAGRHIGPNIPISNADGTPILQTNRRGISIQRTTGEKAALVYQYLLTNRPVHAYSFGFKWTDGKDVYCPGANVAPNLTRKDVSLWEVVQAIYLIRNAVAHSGYYSPPVSPTADREILAKLFFTSMPMSASFLGIETRAAVFRELAAVPIP